MDIEKQIEQLRKSADFEDYPIVASFAAIIEKKYLRETATALSTLQAENEKLRAENNMLRRMQPVELNGEAARSLSLALEASQLREELERVKRERDAAVALVHEWEQYGRYLSPMGFTVPPNWRED